MDGDGRRRRRLLRDDDGAVGEHRARTGARPRWIVVVIRRPAAGSNRPTVRFTGVERAVAAAADHLFQRHRVDPLAQRFGTCRQLPIVSKYPSWCAMLVMLSFSKTSRARSWSRRLLHLGLGHASSPHAVDLGERRLLESIERRPVGRRERNRVEERLLCRHDAARHRRRETRVDERAIQARASLRRRRAEARPQVQPLRAGQHGVEHEHREEVGVCRCRRVVADLEIGRRAFARDRHAPLAELLGLARMRTPRRRRRAAMPPKCCVDPPHRVARRRRRRR